jgi:hypothetical protein
VASSAVQARADVQGVRAEPDRALLHTSQELAVLRAQVTDSVGEEGLLAVALGRATADLERRLDMVLTAHMDT